MLFLARNHRYLHNLQLERTDEAEGIQIPVQLMRVVIRVQTYGKSTNTYDGS
jgi:hypothetical protein